MKEITVRDVCGDYALDIKLCDNSVFTLYFNSRQNALNVKRIMEVDGSVPNVATVCDMVEVVRCEKCEHKVDYKGRVMCGRRAIKYDGGWSGLRATDSDHYCSYGEKRKDGSGE